MFYESELNISLHITENMFTIENIKNTILYKIVLKIPPFHAIASILYTTIFLPIWVYGKILSGRDIPFRKKSNYLKCLYSTRHRLKRSSGHPILLTIEPTNVCDQKCPVCETGAGVLGRKKRFMSYHEFTSILDQFDDNLDQMFFYFMGEAFLNKEAYRMIRYATDRGIRVSSCTNGNYIDPEQLVNSGIAEIDFQIAGMTQEVHQIYRVGGELKKTLQALEETLRLRNQPDCPNKQMKISVGFILMKHNEHQVEEFIQYAQRIGVDTYNIIGTCARNVEQAVQFLPTKPEYRIYDEEALQQGKLRPKYRPNNSCGWIYSTITIQVNGDVVPCCRDPKGEYVLGNVFDTPVYQIWNNEKFRALRKTVSTQSNTFHLCQFCGGYGIPGLKPQ